MKCTAKIIDESVPEFANQYQYQYQYQKKYSVQYETSTSTAQVLSVPVPASTSTTNIDQKRREIWNFREKNQFFMREIQIEKSNFEFLSLKLKFEKKNLTYFGKLHGCQFICLIFAVFLFWYWYWLTQYLRDQYQYRVSTWKLDQ